MKTFIKNYMKAVGVVCACMAAFPACTDMMETDSTTVGFEEDNRLDSPNDSLYSVLGILSQVQRLGDRYVLLGELRGDLMEATADAHVDIQEISNFSVSSGNEYASFYDYYNVINNCNYAIAKMDTNIVFYEDKVMIPEYAQIKVIRAWTYWQLGLATGQVSWIEEPVLSLESALKINPQKNTVMLGDAEQLKAGYMLAEEENLTDEDEFFGSEELTVRIRYRSKPIPCTVKRLEDGRLLVHFLSEASAIAPGQSAVFYVGRRVVGGSFIASQRGIGMFL